MTTGPLVGVRLVEFAGIGPAPFCTMLLSDMGADVVRIDRKTPGNFPNTFSETPESAKYNTPNRGRRSVALDLKKPEGVQIALTLLEKADVLIEGYRPGVMERLGLGPKICLEKNPRLIYGRMTGWGQSGPLAKAAGHDINYIALGGALHAIGPTEGKPVPPLNLVGDFGGGALYLAMGLCAALYERERSGHGQVIDCAMTDGVLSLMGPLHSMITMGLMSTQRGENLLDGGAHFYDTYETSDGKWIAIGSIEPQFYALLREKLSLEESAFDAQMDPAAWPALSEKLANIFKTKTRDQWCALLEGSDVCFAPVLTSIEAAEHPHNVARKAVVTIDGVPQPNVSPRFSRTPSQIQGPPPASGAQTEEILREWGNFSQEHIDSLRTAQVI